MRGVILAAGFGTRLWPLTEDRTKPAIPFLNQPLISYSVQHLSSHGIREIIINLHHKPDSIRDALGSGDLYGARVQYSYEGEILGTSGALDRVRDRLLDGDFVVINGKIVTTVNLDEAIRHHRETAALATLVLRENPRRDPFSIVEVAAGGRIKGFGPHPRPLARIGESEQLWREHLGHRIPTASPPGVQAAEEMAPLMFTGIQVLSPRIFEYIPRGVFSHSTVHVYPRAIDAGERVVAFVSADGWYEMSTLGRYLEASLALMDHAGPDASERRFVSGRDCVIEPGAEVRDSVLWDRVAVEAGARVDLSILGDGVRVPAGLEVFRSAVVRRDRVDKIERGTVIGDLVMVPID